ncbi:HTH-type transcriptional repressor CytR [subsurface metagenome]
MLTQNEIARIAGLSRMTVYRYLTGKNVSAKSRKTLEEILAKTEYRPNLTARSLVLKKTNLIGLLVPSVSYSFYPDIIQAIQKTIKNAGYNMMLTVSYEDPAQEKEEIDLLLSIPVDGIVIIPTSFPESERNCALLVKETPPFVMVDRYFSNINASHVATDSFTSSKDIVQYLIDLGHRRIAHAGGPISNSFAKGVRDGYEAALKQNNIPVDNNLIFSGSMDGEDVAEILEQILAIEDRPTAIQAVNDINAIAIMEETKKKKIKIPKDLSLVGFSDIRTARLLEVPLTTIKERATLMGEEAARILINKLKRKTKKKVSKLLEGELIIRQSSAAYAFQQKS